MQNLIGAGCIVGLEIRLIFEWKLFVESMNFSCVYLIRKSIVILKHDLEKHKNIL